MKNDVLFFLLIGANSAKAIGYSGLNADLEYLYLGVILFMLKNRFLWMFKRAVILARLCVDALIRSGLECPVKKNLLLSMNLSGRFIGLFEVIVFVFVFIKAMRF